jgi:hypothetical protein
LKGKIAGYLESLLAKDNFDSQKLQLTEYLAKYVKLNDKNQQAEARVMMFKKDLRRVLRENGIAFGSLSG